MKTNIKLSIIVLLLSQFSCKTTTSENAQREMIPNPEKYVHDGYGLLPDTLRPVFYPDTMIGNISLLNKDNVIDYLGSDVMERLVDDGLLETTVLSKDRRQRLKVIFHPGGSKNKFSEFEISYNDKADEDLWIVEDDEFITENNIKLGITVGGLRSIKGEPDSVINGSTVTFRYEIDQGDRSEFLIKYNMPLYYSDYEFQNGYLIRFKFGFEYP